MLDSIPSTSYVAAIANFLSTAFPVSNETSSANSVACSQGETLIPVMGSGSRAYIVTSGELAIYVNGQLVDFIDAGEYFDESIWPGGKAIAFTDCVLHPVSHPQPVHH